MQEGRDHVARQAGDPRVAEVDVRDDQRPAGRLDDHVGERLVGGHDGRAVPPGTLGAQRVVQCLAQRAPCRRDLRLGLSGSDLEREVERRVLREQPEHVVEHRHAGRDLGLAGAVHVDAGEQPPGFVSLTRPSHPWRSVAQASGPKSGRHR